MQFYVLMYIVGGYVTGIYYWLNELDLYIAIVIFWPYFWGRGLWRSWQKAWKT